MILHFLTIFEGTIRGKIPTFYSLKLNSFEAPLKLNSFEEQLNKFPESHHFVPSVLLKFDKKVIG